MTTILLPMLHFSVLRIINKEKVYIYQRKIPSKRFDKIIAYSIAPQKAIYAEFFVGEILSGSPKDVWDKTANKGIDDEDIYWQYVGDKKIIYAIEVINFNVFKKPKKLKNYYINYNPRGFVYAPFEPNNDEY